MIEYKKSSNLLYAEDAFTNNYINQYSRYKNNNDSKNRYNDDNIKYNYYRNNLDNIDIGINNENLNLMIIKYQIKNQILILK